MLEKYFNYYTVDDVFDEEFAYDFSLQALEEKYRNDDISTDFIEYVIFNDPNYDWLHKYSEDDFSHFCKRNNICMEKPMGVDEYIKIMNMYEAHAHEYFKMHGKVQGEDTEKMFSPLEETNDSYDQTEPLPEVGYDEEYIYHDRDMDYDYDYENDCEYDGDEEFYGYDE